MEKRADVKFRDKVCCPFCCHMAEPRWAPARVWKCSQCHLLFRHPVERNSTLDNLYASSWQKPESYISETGGTIIELANRYVDLLAGSLGLRNFEGLRILDFGAGRGAIVRVLSERGGEVFAVDPYGFSFLRRQGIDAVAELEDLPYGISFDGVLAIDVIEHLVAPWSKIAELRKVTKPTGWLYLATPNAGGLKARLLKGNWEEAEKQGHLYFFSARSLEAMLGRCWSSRFQRLSWHVRYSDDLVKRAGHWSLQSLYLDGQLRYLALGDGSVFNS